ncbi:hypothetical protein [Alicyclobacillus macrosporangiidus]|uniref:hypothetical protein n=1 Tax=Alicyclobacillus macrosporangiidus TaxID=392015 RepID=UPI000496063D|nr:hypothetical protein [Alicyclobacillus macrosporangiidus]
MSRADLEERLRRLGQVPVLEPQRQARLRDRLEQDIARHGARRWKRGRARWRMAAVWGSVACAGVAAAAVWMVHAVAVSAGGVSATNPPGHAGQNQTVNAQPETTDAFDNRLHWTGAHSYTPGVQRTTVVPAPARYESSQIPTDGAVAEISVSNHAARIDPDVHGTPAITAQIVFDGSILRINGQSYTVPDAYRDRQLLVLPLDRGIVWSPTDPQSRSVPHFTMADNRMAPNPAALQGATDIFYTPYRETGGSLADGAVRIASLPHAWKGAPWPVVASAWTGWLPADRVRQPRREEIAGYRISPKENGPQYGALQSAQKVTQFAGFPTSFRTSVPGLAKGEQPCVAEVGSLTRTWGGFVLAVTLNDPNHGGNAGVCEADYYWSEADNQWVPLTQIYIVQTIAGFSDAGSGSVYWEEALPASSGNDLYVAQMRYDPKTNTMQSLWLGNWVYGASFVDGDSWVVQMPDQMQKGWTVYSPAE